MTKISASRVKNTFDQAISPFLPGKAAWAGPAANTMGDAIAAATKARTSRCMVGAPFRDGAVEHTSRGWAREEEGADADGADGWGGVRRDGGAGLGGRRRLRRGTDPGGRSGPGRRRGGGRLRLRPAARVVRLPHPPIHRVRSEEHTTELQSREN